MQSKQRMKVAASVASLVLLGGALLGGGVASAAKKKGKSKAGKTVRVTDAKSRTIPDAVSGSFWGALPTSLNVNKRFKGTEVADVRLTLRTTGLAVASAADLMFRITAPNGRTVTVTAPFSGQSIGPLTVTANSPITICNSPPCVDPNARLGPPYFGTLGDPNLALLDGAGVSGRWVVTAYDQSTGNTSALNSVGLLIRTRAAGSGRAAASGGTDAAAAAAKKKKKKKRKKCNQRDQSPLFNALSCTKLSRTISNSPPTPSGTEVYDFCRNNTYRYRLSTVGGGEGRHYVTTYRGRWKVISSTSGSSGVSGGIQYTVTGFRSVYDDGAPAEAPPPSVLSEPIVFGPFGVDFSSGTFIRGKAPC